MEGEGEDEVGIMNYGLKKIRGKDGEDEVGSMNNELWKAEAGYGREATQNNARFCPEELYWLSLQYYAR